MKCTSQESIVEQGYAYVRIISSALPNNIYEMDIDSFEFEEGCVKANVIQRDCQYLVEYKLGGKIHAIPITDGSVMSYKPNNLQLVEY